MITRQALIEQFRSVLYISDEQCLDVILAVALHTIAHHDHEPLWILFIGASGSGKTQLAWEPFQTLNGHIKNIDRITPMTFVTGHSKGKDLLPSLNDKLVLMKDFSSIVNMRSDKAIEVFDQLRHIYDGNMAGYWGGEKSSVEYKTFFNLIACVTPEALERARVFNTSLGERMIPIRMRVANEGIAARSLENEGQRLYINEVLQKAMKEFLEAKATTTPPTEDITFSAQAKESIARIVALATHLRTLVDHDYRHEITRWPLGEAPGRVVHALATLSKSLSCVYAHDYVGDSEIAVVRRIGYDMVHLERMCVLEILSRQPCTVAELSALMTLPNITIRRLLEDLWTLSVVEIAETERGALYTISPQVWNWCVKTKFLEGGPVLSSTRTEDIADVIKGEKKVVIL